MPAQPRPTDGDVTTLDHLLIGMPFLEFTQVINGVAQQPVNLGVVDSAELAKELEDLALESTQSGTAVTLRKLISKIDLTFNVGVFNWAPAVQQFSLGSNVATAVVADAAAAVTNETVVTTTDNEDYLALANQGLNSASVTVTASPVVQEVVGTGDGLTGDTQGDFTLQYPIAAVADANVGAGITTTDPSTGTVRSWTAIADAMAAAGDEVEVLIGESATSGDLQFFVGGVAFNIPDGHIINADYTPSHTLTEGLPGGTDDWLVDLKNGRIQIHHAAAKGVNVAILAGQSVDVDYTYVRNAYTLLKPFTQTTFTGTARIRHLADVGINIIWTIPSAEIQITDDALAFADDDFTVANLAINILDAGGSDRFGDLQLYSETQANV